MSQARPASYNPQSVRQRSKSPLSRPTTPLRPSSRSSFRNSQNNGSPFENPLDALEPQFAELSDSMADLEANFMHLQLMHESLSRFGESFASFLYGLNMNAFVVDFPEAPIADSIKRFNKQQRQRENTDTSMTMQSSSVNKAGDGETTFMTSDGSFVDNASMRATPRRKTLSGQPTPATTTATKTNAAPSARGSNIARGRANTRGQRGSGLPRGRGRGAR